MRKFVHEGAWGTLHPSKGGMRINIPSWLALLFAIPLLGIAVLLLVSSLPFIINFLVFWLPGGLFLGLWASSRGVSKDFGLLRINKETTESIFTERDGSQINVVFGHFTSLKIEPVRFANNSIVWRAILCGENCYLVMDGSYSKNKVIKWFAPLADWLGIELDISSEVVDGSGWMLNPPPRTNPYPDRQRAG